MLRDTPQGLRYLLREPGAPAESARVVAPRAGERIRAAVFGVVVDPNITRPLPFAGLGYVDLNFLDRSSRYSFGAFENRLHGYPTASIRFDRGGVLRSVTSVAGRGFRVDAFADVAAVRDPGFGRQLRAYPGVGAALEAGGPFRTLVSVEWGYGFRARRGDGAAGTQAWRITAYRTF